MSLDAPIILVADDDEDDRLMLEIAFRKSGLSGALRFVKDGQELLDYVCRVGSYAARDRAPRPDVIMLDLNMPRKGGLEALREIKSDAELSSIPVVIWTTSEAGEPKGSCIELGAVSFITKPPTLTGLIEALKKAATAAKEPHR